MSFAFCSPRNRSSQSFQGRRKRLSTCTSQIDPPLRGEPFSLEHLATHAEQIAAQHRVSARRHEDRRFIERFESNRRYIAAACQTIAAAVRGGEAISSAAEWVIDNYHVIEEQLREIREDLPRQFYRELPKLDQGAWAGYPRAYELAHELVVHTDSSLNHDLIASFVEAYQRTCALTCGEIWAIPIMLRLVLVENLRRLCCHVLASRDLRSQAVEISRQWLAEQSTARAVPALDSPALVVHLLDCLRESNPDRAGVCLADVAQKFGQPHEAVDELVRKERQRLAADQVSVGNIITSMQVISGLDWKVFFEQVSPVEQILRQDPAAVYHGMDFNTRDQYRHVVEQLARRSLHPETKVASAAIEFANEAERREESDLRRRHVGFFLIDEGRAELEARLHYRPTLRESIERVVRRHAEFIYLGSIWLLTLAVATGLAAVFVAEGSTGAVAWLAVALALVPASELVVSLVNLAITHLLRPRPLPKLELAGQIPARLQTLVVIPTLLTSEKSLKNNLERLEIHSLANPETGLLFALLTDYADAPAEEMPCDADLLSRARAGVDALNARYDDTDEKRFLLLHRPRQWNPQQHVWMGWERKRGKLLELNRLLRGARDTTFLDADKFIDRLQGVRYVITLDADTRTPHGVARQLIGTLAHPLNRAQFDAARGRVIRGYSILQPRVSISLSGSSRSLFTRFCSNSPGLDPYCTAVSDVYQDLFGEGSYTGKGIYDVDAFAAAVDGAFPENTILSHDLIEGCFARVGLATDVELFDEFPAGYVADARRQHRWVRGDWQLVPWLLPEVPSAEGRRKNHLSFLSRWKIIDNLRRSLVAPVVWLSLLAVWLFSPALAATATLAALAVLAAPLVSQMLSVLATWPQGAGWRRHLRDRLRDLARTFVQCACVVIFVPYRAWLMLDAIARTLFRVCVSRRHLLEWETADAAERRLKASRWQTFREMGWVSLFSAVTLAILPWGAIPAAAPLLMAWLLSPVIGHWISRPLKPAESELSPDDRLFLRRTARQTWSFFEEFVVAADHWLPPDNFQEFPRNKVARRISPTNAGFYIVSALTARDFGYCGVHDLVEMLERNLATLDQLDRFRGHFFNWYDTQTLEPLPPRYVSTADSGNMAASLIAAAKGLNDVVRAPLLGGHLAEGIQDAVALVEDALARFQPRGARLGGKGLTEFEDSLAAVRRWAEEVPLDLKGWGRFLERATTLTENLNASIGEFQSVTALRIPELSRKVKLLTAQTASLERDAATLLPWLALASTFVSDASAGEDPFNTSAARSAWSELWGALSSSLSLEKLSRFSEWGAAQVQLIKSSVASQNGSSDAAAKFDAFAAALGAAAGGAMRCRQRFGRLEQLYTATAMQMDFTLTYNPQRRLFSVGYNLDESRADRAHYDLLASEARLASLVAIAKGDVDHRHWFQLGRTLTEIEGTTSLLSWGGTMFEFLMPTLFARDYEDSLLDQSCRAAVKRQISYGRQGNVPWGISESAFSTQAVNSDYHYQSFGVPGLGLKRGLARDLVISPYSTALAALLDPAAAAANFRALAAEGALGEWGFYDAVDYTADRVPTGERRVVVYNYMAHHHGMTLAALSNCLLDHRLQRRFQQQPLIRSTELLLQEKVPVSVLEFQPQSDEAASPLTLAESLEPVSRRITTADTALPHAHLLSNGQYTVMLTNAGGGFSLCRGIAVSRWRSDSTRDPWGQFIYLRDVDTGRLWSAGGQPVGSPPDNYEVTFSVDKAEICRLDGTIETHLQVAVSPENNAEVRQVTLKNQGERPVTVEITSFMEIALARPAADLAHPAFSKLFIETEYLPEYRALLARRRPREAADPPLWAVHVVALPASAEPVVEYETDRARFLGRGRSAADPAAFDSDAKLSGTTGAVLDPIFSLRHRLHVGPDESAELSFITAFADSREEALSLADQYHDPRVVQRTFELAWASSQVELHRLKTSPAAVQHYQRLASAALFPDAAWRAPEGVLKSNRRGQTALWRFGISGDNPIVLLRVSQPDHRGLLRELLLAHEFWQAHAFKVDLVVLNDQPGGYFDVFHEQLRELIQTTIQHPMNEAGGVYLLRGAQTAPEDLGLLQAAAAICLLGDGGTLVRQIETAVERRSNSGPPSRKSQQAAAMRAGRGSPAAGRKKVRQSGTFQSGFSEDGGSYFIRLAQGALAPAPWSNCVANENFGFLVTESGGGFTWAENSRENKLTSWSNDQVSDPPAEIVYVRDDATGDVWTATPLPIRDDGEYLIVHGHGYSTFTRTAHDVETELLLSIAARDPVKFARLTLRNRGRQTRSLSVVYFAELVLGVSREQTQMHVWTAIDEKTGAVMARNPFQEDFPDQVIFLNTVDGPDSVTGDRAGFVGRNRDYGRPAALEHPQLAGTVGAGLDPCAAVHKQVTLAPGQEVEVVFLLGQGRSSEQAAETMARFATLAQIRAAIDETREFWNRTLAAVEIKTPNEAMNLLVNRWLLYQVLSCRVWGRSAFYQAGGAFGFRDQLQDVMACVYALPAVARAHILRAASRQFEEGDVQHWWHPPHGRGVRTRFSDDYLWLALATSHYITVTGDQAILNERVPYLKTALLEPAEHERYELPGQSPLVEDLGSHCVRAIERAFRYGPHGLPLIGTGDWNDGFSKVGALGQGESVWLTWFLAVVLRKFAPLLEMRGDRDRAVTYRAKADALVSAAEQSAWDGDWYLRAFFDDGSPLGSARNDECRIDSLAQSWSVMAGADPARSTRAMQAVDEQLVRAADRLVLLFAPPFDKTSLDPGYIKGYLRGIRENGGQYTHAAAWVVQAAALQGRGARAVELFDLLNPVLHGNSADGEARYRVEPYVVAADVYGHPPHTGRGGWTWYTGSASWMYRVAFESILGISVAGDRISISPSIPPDWPEFEVVLRRPRGTCRIVVKNPRGVETGVRRVSRDGQPVEGHDVPFVDDGDHLIEVEMG